MTIRRVGGERADFLGLGPKVNSLLTGYLLEIRVRIARDMRPSDITYIIIIIL